MTRADSAPPATIPALAWKALAPLIAARPSMRIWDPDSNKFDRSRTLSSKLPRLPAAVPLYLRERTQVLALDFDTKRHPQHVVDADFTTALTWITDAGGLTVTDHSTSGGRHILVPLAIGTSATLAEINTLMRLFEARLPSLDKTPMTNPATGCITVPGTACREGGHRTLDGPLAAAVDAFTVRSNPGLLPHLYAMLGALRPTGIPDTSQRCAHSAITGEGANARLRSEYTRAGDLPPRIANYARTGQLPPDTTWPSHSEARQSVLAHAALHGHSLATIRALTAPGRPWHDGLARAYTRYHRNADAALQRDFAKALTWAAANVHNFRPIRAQAPEHTRGAGAGHLLHKTWLTNATAWLDHQFPHHRYRWVGAAVYQALALHAVLAGEVINGVPVVGVGGRSLSIATGLLSETTVWQFLRDTRDIAGSPLVRTRTAYGREPDYYALTQQNRVGTHRDESAAIRIEEVHMAWKIIGHQHRRVYDAIVYQELQRPQEVFGAARVSASTGYATLTALATAGLITRTRGHLARGPVTLDEIASAHRLQDLRAQRIERHRRERAGWHDWLATREELHAPRTPGLDADAVMRTPAPVEHHDEYLSAVLATGPPTLDDEYEALALLAELVGARVLRAG